MGAPIFRIPSSKPDQPPRPARKKGFRLKSEGADEGEAIWLLSYSDLMTLLFGFFVMLMSFSKFDLEHFESTRKATTQLFGGEYQAPLSDVGEELTGRLEEELELHGISEHAYFDEFAEGMMITFRGNVFFDSGSSELLPSAKELLEQVVPSILEIHDQYYVVVEGHTDDNPISTERFPSNWELSGHRASAVLRFFEQRGFAAESMRAIGFADTVPIVPNRDEHGQPIARNQEQNRRVVIKLIER